MNNNNYIPAKTKKTLYELRKIGIAKCSTEGSEHYKSLGAEPIDLMVSNDIIEGFCLGNIIKYATRFKKTQNVKDLMKVADYAHIMCGVKLVEMEDNNGLSEKISNVSESKHAQRPKHGTK